MDCGAELRALSEHELTLPKNARLDRQALPDRLTVVGLHMLSNPCRIVADIEVDSSLATRKEVACYRNGIGPEIWQNIEGCTKARL